MIHVSKHFQRPLKQKGKTQNAISLGTQQLIPAVQRADGNHHRVGNLLPGEPEGLLEAVKGGAWQPALDPCWPDFSFWIADQIAQGRFHCILTGQGALPTI
jgi:hypothetical protein